MKYISANSYVWLARIISLSILSLAFLLLSIFLVFPFEKSKANDVWQDPRYASVLREIKDQNLKLPLINKAFNGERKNNAVGLFFGVFIGSAVLLGGYSVINIMVSDILLRVVEKNK